MRDIIRVNKTLGDGSFGGRWMMHACTDGVSNVSRQEYTGSAFNNNNTVASSVGVAIYNIEFLTNVYTVPQKRYCRTR